MNLRHLPRQHALRQKKDRGRGWHVMRWILGISFLAGLIVMSAPLAADPKNDPGGQRPPSAPSVKFAELSDTPEVIRVQNELPKALPPVDKMPKLGGDELPAPKGIAPFGPDKIRMPRLDANPGPLGATPKATDEQLKVYNQFVESIVDPGHTIDLVLGRTRLILLKETPSQVQVADEAIMGHNLLAPKQFIIIGRQIGTTVMTLWFPDPKDKNKDVILSYLVRVIPDPEQKKRLEAIYHALEIEINKAFPDSRIKLSLVGDKLVISGQAKDVAEATQILRIARANAPGEALRVPVNNINVDVRAADLLNPSGTPGLDSFLTAGGPNVINQIRIPGEQQVMLRVTVAEVSRSAARSIGLNFNIINNQGISVFGQQTGGITVGGGVLIQNQQQNNQGGVLANLPIRLDNGQIPIAIDALKTLNYARSLAEPNLVATNGHPASFRSGGQFPVPVIGGFGNTQGGGSGLTGVQFVPFGVQLTFTPFITDRDRIRLEVQAEVSTRDVSTGANIGGANVPGLNARNFNSTVEMREGQTLAVAGLIQNNIGSATNRVPFFGDIPIFNRLTGLDRIQQGESELVILITPELVHPLDKKEVTKLPGSDLFEPSDLEFFLYGRVEGRRSSDYRSSVMDDIHRMIRYKHCEREYIFGPVGHIDDPNYPTLDYPALP